MSLEMGGQTRYYFHQGRRCPGNFGEIFVSNSPGEDGSFALTFTKPESIFFENYYLINPTMSAGSSHLRPISLFKPAKSRNIEITINDV